ncbi:MAG: tyrosine-type recombinase/integrase [Lachnospiraceae bacterium]|nr:tyrosine-type recombinase/integrase [Lachnospiraceae bacterium]
MLLDDVLEEFILNCRIRKLSKKTIVSYCNANKALFQFLKSEYGITKLEKVNKVCMKAYIEHLIEKDLKESYVNAQIRNFRAFFKYCEDEGYIIVNPVNRIRWQKEEMPIIETFTDAEVMRMMHYYKGNRYMQARNRLILAILFDTGLRCHELCDLRVGDIRETYLHIRGKGKKVRHVPISDILRKYMLQYERARRPFIKSKSTEYSEFYLLSQKAKPLSEPTIWRIVHNVGRTVNVRPQIRCSPHTCRHYYAQKLLQNHVDLYSVSKLLGHSNLQITRRYLQSMDDNAFFEMNSDSSPLSTLAAGIVVHKRKGQE